MVAGHFSRIEDECGEESPPDRFLDLAEARQLMEAWQIDDNQVRPHSG
jgi:hypothetical protein